MSTSTTLLLPPVAAPVPSLTPDEAIAVADREVLALRAFRDQVPLANDPDADVLGLMSDICRDLDRGYTPGQILASYVRAAAGNQHAMNIANATMGLAPFTYCPEQAPAMEAFFL